MVAIDGVIDHVSDEHGAPLPRGMKLSNISQAFPQALKNTPDTPANERAFGRPSGGDRGMGAYPQIRKVSLVEVGTHAEIGVVFKGLSCGETTAMKGLWKHLPKDALLLEDRVFLAMSTGNERFLRTSPFLLA